MQDLFDGTDGPQRGPVPTRPNPSYTRADRRYTALIGLLASLFTFATFPVRLWLNATILDPTAMNLWIVTVVVGIGAFLVLELVLTLADLTRQ